MKTDWVAKKPQTYCRQHGHRITGYINGFAICNRCLLADVVERALNDVDEILYGDDSDFSDECGCKQAVGQPRVICPLHKKGLHAMCAALCKGCKLHEPVARQEAGLNLEHFGPVGPTQACDAESLRTKMDYWDD